MFIVLRPFVHSLPGSHYSHFSHNWPVTLRNLGCVLRLQRLNVPPWTGRRSMQPRFLLN